MSWFDTVLKAAAGKILVMEQVDKPVADFRWQICWTCKYREPEKNTCLICGCFLEVKVWSKTSRAAHRPAGEITHCPMGKWGDLEIANHYRVLDGVGPVPPEEVEEHTPPPTTPPKFEEPTSEPATPTTSTPPKDEPFTF